MWASRPSHCDNDMPIDLRKKVVLQRDQEESQKKASIFKPRVNHYAERERWPQPTTLPVNNLYPFMSERYGVRFSLVNQDENKSLDARYGSRGTLETTIRKLHYYRQLKKEPPRVERCRSVDILEKREKDKSLESKRSSSCPNLTVIKPKPSPIKPKSSFIQRSSQSLLNGKSELYSNSISSAFHPEFDDNSLPIGGAKKRKSSIPVYGDRMASPERKRSKSPAEHSPYDEYFSHPEVLLRRQLAQHSPSPYLVHVYDYYQQLVQRLREHSSPGVHLQAPVSPNSMDEEMPSDPQRRRPCRALTGKHVRQGTGASMSTLLTLRQKIEERQRAKEHHPLFNGSCNKNINPKKNKAQKSKPNPKNLMNKI